MRKFLVVSMMLGLGLGACGGGSGLEGEMQDWKSKMCKCTDKACADKTFDEYREWTKGKREAAKDLSKSDREKLGSIEKELKDCRRKHNEPAGDKAADAPAGDKAPEAPAAPAATP